MCRLDQLALLCLHPAILSALEKVYAEPCLRDGGDCKR